MVFKTDGDGVAAIELASSAGDELGQTQFEKPAGLETKGRLAFDELEHFPKIERQRELIVRLDASLRTCRM